MCRLNTLGHSLELASDRSEQEFRVLVSNVRGLQPTGRRRWRSADERTSGTKRERGKGRALTSGALLVISLARARVA